MALHLPQKTSRFKVNNTRQISGKIFRWKKKWGNGKEKKTEMKEGEKEGKT